MENLSSGQQWGVGLWARNTMAYQIRGQTAEWVAEFLQINEDLKPLVDFGKVKFEAFMASTPEHVLDLASASRLQLVSGPIEAS